MDCPQCGAEVPGSNAFCGRCGYAMRDQDPQRTDQSRIRFHEEPDAEPPAPPAALAKRVRKPTVIGMPALEGRAPAASVGRPEVTGSEPKMSQQTMLGIPRLEPRADSASDSGTDELDPSYTTDRGRAFVRYDSLLEPPSVVVRRKRALRGVAFLVLLAASWLIYRFVNA